MTINSWATSSKWENYEVRSRNGDDLWNLQFTRWWGWNWVKKREELLKEQLLRRLISFVFLFFVSEF